MRACYCCGKRSFLSMGDGLKSFFFRIGFGIGFVFNWGSWVGKDGEESMYEKLE